MELKVGCSGWFYWHWKGRFYPEASPTHKWFQFYRTRFNTVELNAPFYRWPQPSTIKQWRRQATPRYRYSIKVNQIITHEKRFVGTADLINQFYGIAEVLGKQMGCFLFQCPPSFRYSEENLENIVTQLNPDFRNAVEFRHKSWWNDAVVSAFEKRKLIFCSVSGPRLPSDLIKTTPDIYVRFHGTQRWYRHDYSNVELQEWVDKIQGANPERAWIYFNNDFEAFAIKNGRAMRRMLKAAAKVDTRETFGKADRSEQALPVRDFEG